MNNLIELVTQRKRAVAEIYAMRVAAALRDAAPDARIECKGDEVRIAGRGMADRFLFEPALRIAARWAR